MTVSTQKLIIAALILVVAYAWNNAAKLTVRHTLGADEETWGGALLYAVILTLIVSWITWMSGSGNTNT